MDPSFAQDRNGLFGLLHERPHLCGQQRQLCARHFRASTMQPRSRPAPRADHFDVAILRMVRRGIPPEAHIWAFE